MKIRPEDFSSYFEAAGFELEVSLNQSSCSAQAAGILLPFEQLLRCQYLLEGNQSVKNFLDYLIEKRLPELGELGWMLNGDKIISPNNPACLDCPSKMKCFFG